MSELRCGNDVWLYVNAYNTSQDQDGKSWETAFSTLQPALDKASKAKTYVLIAQGVYTPTVQFPLIQGKPVDDRNNTFHISHNTSLIGGFKGGEESISDCNPDKHTTVLDGSDYYRRVVTIGDENARGGGTSASVSISNLTICNGNGDDFRSGNLGNQADGAGGGVYVSDGSTVLFDTVVFRNNRSRRGGAVVSRGSTLVVKNCRFQCNSADHEGAAIQSSFSTVDQKPVKVEVKDSVFVFNSSGGYAGAVSIKAPLRALANEGSYARISGCSFLNNTACIGGAVYINSINTKIEKTSFSYNTATTLAGAVVCKNSIGYAQALLNEVDYKVRKVAITNCDFCKNNALGRPATNQIDLNADDTIPYGAGAIATFSGGYLTAKDTKFSGNTAVLGNGGAIINGGGYQGSLFGAPIKLTSATTILSECKFANNSTLFGDGGAIWGADSPAILDVIDPTFKHNSAPNGEGNDVYVA